jgi:hypothetical protein
VTLAELVDQQLQKTGGQVAVMQDARRNRPRARAKRSPLALKVSSVDRHVRARLFRP